MITSSLPNPLTTQDVYDHDLSLDMVKGYLKANTDDLDSFKFEMNTLRQKLEVLIEDTVYVMDKNDKNQRFKAASLSYKDICVKADRMYHSLKDRYWPAARLPTKV